MGTDAMLADTRRAYSVTVNDAFARRANFEPNRIMSHA